MEVHGVLLSQGLSVLTSMGLGLHGELGSVFEAQGSFQALYVGCALRFIRASLCCPRILSSDVEPL